VRWGRCVIDRLSEDEGEFRILIWRLPILAFLEVHCAPSRIQRIVQQSMRFVVVGRNNNGRDKGFAGSARNPSFPASLSASTVGSNSFFLPPPAALPSFRMQNNFFLSDLPVCPCAY